MKRVHISDTIATHDTTVERLELQYTLLNHTLGYDNFGVEFLASEFGNSKHTAHLALTYMKNHDTSVKNGEFADTICVNNASRAKHKDSGNAKGSGCLRAQVQVTKDGHIWDVVGVDDEVFEELAPYILDIQKIQGISHGKTTVADISQGSQFRSLEYRPAAQMLVHKYKNEKENLHKYIHLLPYTLDNINSKDKDIVPVQELRKELTHTYISNNDTKLQKTQLVGQFDKYFVDRNIKKDQEMVKLREKLVAKSGNELFVNTKKSLLSHQIRVIDKDKFGNIKCMAASKNGIKHITETLEKDIGSKIGLQRKDIDGNSINDYAYKVNSLSDKTGEQCLRNGSSRGPGGEIFVELNISKDETYTNWENLDTLRIGSIITLS